MAARYFGEFNSGRADPVGLQRPDHRPLAPAGPPVRYRLTWENLTAKPWATTDKSPRVSLSPAA